MRELTLRPYREGDEEAINRAFNQVFGLERSLEEWRWKFPDDSAGRWILLALDSASEVVAQYAALPVEIQVGRRRFRVGQVVDAFCSRRRSLSRKGIFSATVERFFADLCGPGKLSLLFGFPGGRHLSLGRLSLGYGDPRPVEYWTRCIAPVRRRQSWPRFRVQAESNPLVIERLWERAAERYPLATIRDAAWIRRRYQSRPGVEYLFLSVWSGGHLHAFAVLRPGTSGECVCLIELVWDGQDPRALAALDDETVRLARQRRSEGLEMWLGGDPRAERALAACGWVRGPHPQGLCLTVRSFDPRLDADQLTRRLYLTMGDADLV